MRKIDPIWTTTNQISMDASRREEALRKMLVDWVFSVTCQRQPKLYPAGTLPRKLRECGCGTCARILETYAILDDLGLKKV